MRRILALASMALAVVVLLSGVDAQSVLGQGTEPPVAAHVWFHEDFSTHANRWRVYDLGKASSDYVMDSLDLQATPANYALWTLPDSDLKPDRFDIQADATLTSGGDDARVGVILGYRSENDMLVLAVSQAGDVYLGRYYFGIWKDLIAPSKVTLDTKKPIAMQAIVDTNHNAHIVVDGQPAGQTTLKDFRATGFGLFAMTGKTGGIDAAFTSYTVSDAQ